MRPTYNFPVIRGIQAGHEFYLAICPLKLIPKLFVYDEEVVPAELRAQRILNKARIPQIANYIIDNPKEYVFSAITASIDASVEFTPLPIDQSENLIFGWLVIPMDAMIIINDGQHRRAAIEEALKARPELADESIAVVFFIDAGLKRSQQMFADLNKHAVRPSQSLGVLYEHREPLAVLSRKLIQDVDIFRHMTEKEKTSISNRSTKLFTLSGIYQATQELLRKKNNGPISQKEIELAIEFWNEVAKSIPEWNMALEKQISCAVMREEYVHAHGVVLQALGIVGAELISQYPEEWKKRLVVLKNVNWARSNTVVWEGRAMFQGRINKGIRQVNLTANYIKGVLALPLTIEEQILEDSFLQGHVK